MLFRSPYFNRQNNDDLILAIQSAGVERGRNGFRINARTAANAIRQREFDLVLLDINLPDGNGFELCKLIKPQHPDTIVIFLTANDQESDQIRREFPRCGKILRYGRCGKL